MIEQIYKRKSIRKYNQAPLEAKVLDKIKYIIDNQKPLFDNLKYKVDLVYDGKAFRNVLSGIIGSYGKVHAPHYLVVSCEDGDSAYENIGYLLEYIVLHLTEMNIGTCWIGGGIKRDLFSDYLKLEKNLTPIVVIAFGYPENYDIIKDVGQYKRKNINQITFGNFELYDDVMELVRLAPSAINLQPWRYDFIDKNHVDIYRIKQNIIMKKFVNELNRIDIGISISHFEIGLNRNGKKMRIVDLKKNNKNMIYYKTICID